MNQHDKIPLSEKAIIDSMILALRYKLGKHGFVPLITVALSETSLEVRKSHFAFKLFKDSGADTHQLHNYIRLDEGWKLQLDRSRP